MDASMLAQLLREAEEHHAPCEAAATARVDVDAALADHHTCMPSLPAKQVVCSKGEARRCDASSIPPAPHTRL